MKKIIAVIIILFMVLMGFPNTMAAGAPLPNTMAAGAPVDDSRLFMTPDGLYWTDDMRVTANSATDNIPQITVDKNHDAHIFWMRDGWYYKKFDRFGNALTKEKQINT